MSAVTWWAAALVLLPAPAPPHVLFHLADPRIAEASGIALGHRSPGIAYVQNDSGDRARFFALDARTGRTAATVTVAGARNVDWEDIAVAPGADGVSSVWLADIGDNGATRDEIRVYRVPEPRIRPAGRGRSLPTRPAGVWRLRYPSGPVDAESLAVSPAGTAYVVTKSPLGHSVVYRVPPRPDRRHVQSLVRIGSIQLTPHGTANPFGIPGELAVTGAAISPDGRHFAVRTYAAAYVWSLPAGDLAAALRRPPVRVPLPAQPQGEGIALTGDTAVVDSEGAGTAVYAVPLPVSGGAAPRPVPVRPSTGAGRSTPVSGSPTPGAPWWPAAAAGLLVLGLGVAGIAWRRGRIRGWRSPRSTRP